MKKHEKQLAFERRRIGSAGRIQGWFRGYLGRQWGKRYMSRVKDERNARFQRKNVPVFSLSGSSLRP